MIDQTKAIVDKALWFLPPPQMFSQSEFRAWALTLPQKPSAAAIERAWWAYELELEASAYDPLKDQTTYMTGEEWSALSPESKRLRALSDKV